MIGLLYEHFTGQQYSLGLNEPYSAHNNQKVYGNLLFAQVIVQSAIGIQAAKDI